MHTKLRSPRWLQRLISKLFPGSSPSGSVRVIAPRQAPVHARLDNSLLYNNREWEHLSDMTFVCGTRSWKLHKSVILPRSGVLKRELKDSRWAEGEEATVSHEQFDAATVACMIQWMYNGYYDLKHFPETKDDLVDGQIVRKRNRRLIQHAKVHAIADYYEIKGLQEYVEAEFSHCCDTMYYTQGFTAVIEALDGMMSERVNAKEPQLISHALRFAKRHAWKLLNDPDFEARLDTCPAVREFHIRLVKGMAKDEYDMTSCRRRSLQGSMISRTSSYADARPDLWNDQVQ